MGSALSAILSVLPRFAAGVATGPMNPGQLTVLVEGHLVPAEHVGRVRHPLELEHLERHRPLPSVLLHPSDRLDRTADQVVHLPDGLSDHLARGAIAARATAIPAAAARGTAAGR